MNNPLGRLGFPPRITRLFGLGLLLVLAARSVAQEASQDFVLSESPAEREARALDLFAEGQLLEETGKAAEALQAYEASAQALDPSPTLLLAMARCAFYLPDYKKARAYADRARAIDPANAEADFLGGSASYRLGAVSESIQSLERAVSRDSVTVRYAETLGSILEAEGRSQDALAVFARLARSHPYDVHVLFRLGTLQLQLGKNDEAVATFETAVREDSSYPGLLGRFGSALDAAGQLERAAEAYRGAIDQNPNDLPTRRRLIDVLFVSGQIAEALREARTLRHLLPDDPEVNQRLAAIAFGAGEFSEALEALAHLEELRAMSPELYTLRAEIYSRRGELPEARRAAESALDQDPDNVRATVVLARVMMRAGEIEEAEKTLTSAVAKNGKNADLRYGLALLLSEEGKYVDALHHLDALHASATDNLDVAFSRGVALERTGQFGAAVKAFRDIIDKGPRHSPALNYLGFMFAERGENLEEARSLIQRAVDLDPKNPAYLDSMGWVLFKMGQPTEGKKFLEEAASLSTDPTIREHLGDCLMAVGQPEDAIQQYRLAIESGGGETPIQEKISEAQRKATEMKEPSEGARVKGGEEITP